MGASEISVLLMTGSLGVVDAVVPAEEIAGDAGDRGEGAGFRAEELEGHEGRGDGGVGGAGEDGHEAHGGEQRGGKWDGAGEAVAEGGPDEEQGRDFAAFVAGAEGESGEGELGGEGEAGHGLVEGGNNSGNAEADVALGVGSEDDDGDQGTADKGTEWRVGEETFVDGADGVGEAGEGERGEAEDDAGKGGVEKSARGDGGGASEGVDEIGCVVDAPSAGW